MQPSTTCKALATLLLLAALLLASNCTRKAQITIDGSSTVYPITEGIAEEFRKHDQSVNVTVGISGTGGGFKKFCNRETALSDASRRIKPSEVKRCTAAGVEYVEVSVAYDGLAVVVSKSNTFLKKLDVQTLHKIFRSDGPARSWREVDPSYPDLPIKVFSPGQDSGTFDYFRETVLGKNKRIRSDATFSEDDNVLVTGVAGNKGGIGFFGVAYYTENKSKLNLIPIVNPRTGRAVRPSIPTVKSGAYSPLSRPLFIYVRTAALKQPAVSRFVRFYLNNAGKISKDVGYIPLEEKLYARGLRDLGLK